MLLYLQLLKNITKYFTTILKVALLRVVLNLIGLLHKWLMIKILHKKKLKIYIAYLGQELIFLLFAILEPIANDERFRTKVTNRIFLIRFLSMKKTDLSEDVST